MSTLNIEECFERLSAYFQSNNDKSRTLSGQALLVNTENYDVFQSILQRLQADKSKKILYVSDNCFPNGLPDLDTCMEKIRNPGNYALVGFSPAIMFQGNVREKLGEILGLSIHGNVVVLLDHCEQQLTKLMGQDIRLRQRIVLVEGERSEMPKIRVAKNETECPEPKAKKNFQELLHYLEHLSVAQYHSHPELTVISPLNVEVFKDSAFAVTKAAGIYESLCKQYPDLAGGSRAEYGALAQWKWLSEKIKGHDSFSALICDCFGSTANLNMHLADTSERDENTRWLLWLGMKFFGVKNNHYLTRVLENCSSSDCFIEHVYLDLAEMKLDEPDFIDCYRERKRLLEQLPENLTLVSTYCEKLGIHQKDEIFYLTDGSEQERLEFMRCLNIYRAEYSEENIALAAEQFSEPLELYLRRFMFDSTNTKLPDSESEFRYELTSYFEEYKKQKLLNQIDDSFMERVNTYAKTRPYNKVQPRSKIVSKLDKNGAVLYFFDALGVEYLSFIAAKCEEIGMIAEISIGRSELPSITSKNKEFLQYFPEQNVRNIKDLDEMKHHSQVYNYEHCKLPIHLYEELEVISNEIRKIYSALVQGEMEKAIIVSDHGASRLAVLYGKEVDDTIALEESGIHSGRCCPIAEDPNLDTAAYEDGFSVLANYDRFRGGRRANVEVHGGASLEEVIVPVITLTKKPKDLEIILEESKIILSRKTIPSLTIYSNVPLQKPMLKYDGEFIEGKFVGDKKHARFELSQIKRKGKYSVDVYDGEKNLSVTLEFEVTKKTGMNTGFSLN